MKQLSIVKTTLFIVAIGILAGCATVQERAAEKIIARVDATADQPMMAPVWAEHPELAKAGQVGAAVSSPSVSNVTLVSGSIEPSAPAALPLRSTIAGHLVNAADIARAAGDAPGVQCWTTLGKWVETLPLAKADVMPDPVLPEATGPSGRAELVRIRTKLAEQRVNAVKARVAALRGIIDAGVPDDVVTACAVVVHDARSVVVRVLNVIGLAGL